MNLRQRRCIYLCYTIYKLNNNNNKNKTVKSFLLFVYVSFVI